MPPLRCAGTFARRLVPLAPFALVLAVIAATFAPTSGCRRATPDAPPVPAPLGELQVLKDGRYLFTYVEPSGTFATTDKPEIIPEVARKMVRVIDPAETKMKDSTGVYTVNVNDLLKARKAPARPLSREAFETSAEAQLPPGDSSLVGGRAPGAPAPAHGVAPDAGVIASPPGKPVVTIYGTSWCGACRAAREFLTERKIPFADKDVERDPDAARELATKAAKMGIPTDRVPVIDVRGVLLLGFDRARIESLLGQPT